MCEFFSCVSDGKGNIWYLDWNIRKKIIDGELSYNADSHASICDYYKLREDKCNKYEYNPFTGKFTVDMLNNKDDSIRVERKVRKLDFSNVVPQLIIKPIYHPLKKTQYRVSKKDIKNLKQWTSVMYSVRYSVRTSVGTSVMHSVRASIWYSVWGSVVGSVVGSVGGSVWDSVGNSVRASVWAYISSFFNLDKWKNIDHKPGENPFQCGIDLWERDLVPSFDGEVWRLHSGPNAKIVYEAII